MAIRIYTPVVKAPLGGDKQLGAGLPVAIHRAKFTAARTELVAAARKARAEEARHYDNYRVGVAFQVYRAASKSWDIIASGNLKMIGPDKKCAEMASFEKTQAGGYDLITGMVVCADPRPDDDSGVVRDPRHPCCPCQIKLVEYATPKEPGAPTLITLDTPILAMHVTDDGRFEEILLRDLPVIHKVGWDKLRPGNPPNGDVWHP